VTRRGTFAAIVLGFCGLTIMMTWPLLDPRSHGVPDSDDAYFSVWRLGWFAHQLPLDPRRLFDANIFHPVTGTLAFSDAMLLVAALGAPLAWLGIGPGLTHNILLGAAFVTSMWFAFLLVRELTGSPRAAWLAALIFGFAPYRFAHIGHVELQWVMWMPLGLWLLHRFVAAPTAPRALAVGAALTGQALCSIYYGVFLSLYLAAAWLALMFVHGTSRRRAIVLAPMMVVPLLAVALIYGPPYSRTRAEQGARDVTEITNYSATPADFLRVPPINRLRGRPDGGPAPDERSLYPGLAAVLLAALAFRPPVPRLAWVYLALTALTVDFSLGMHGVLYPLLHQAVPLLSSLRSSARFGVLVLLSLSVLAGFGAAGLFRARPRYATAIGVIATALCVLEYWSAPVSIRADQRQPTEAHRWLARQPAGSVVVELPMPKGEALWLYETTYQVRSTHHWQPLVNGYGGFAPREYRHTLEAVRGFPDPPSMQRLRELQVRFVLINRVYYTEDEFNRLLAAVIASPAFWPPRSFGPDHDQILVAELKEPPAPQSRSSNPTVNRE
jgi:hypothetical protein